MPASVTLFDITKTAPIWDSYLELSTKTELGIFPSVLEESDDFPHTTTFIFRGVIVEEAENGTVPSTEVMEGLEHREVCTYISPTPTYDKMPQFPFEESHYHMSHLSTSAICDIEYISYERMSVNTTIPVHENMQNFLYEVESHHHLLSNSTNHMSESILEGVGEPQHLVSEVVDGEHEATMISNNLTSTPIVSSSLVQGLIYDDVPTLDKSIPPMGMAMAMMDDDEPHRWFCYDVNHELVFTTSPTSHERSSKGNIGDGSLHVPLVYYLDIDCFHDVDPPIDMLHDYATSSCDELPIYDEFDDSHEESINCDDVLHRISCENSLGHIKFDNLLDLSYAMHEITHIASLQSHHSNYAYATKINPIFSYA
ncbi:gag-pol polyprotein [Hordeum vulgare]|nr:gag-pol polyprotein [Hordeum vulgare]